MQTVASLYFYVYWFKTCYCLPYFWWFIPVEKGFTIYGRDDDTAQISW
jgi:hypothetical protein